MERTAKRAAKAKMRTSTTTNRIDGRSCRNAGGFTLVELLAVSVIVALLGSVAISFGHGTYKRLLVERAAKDVYFAAKYARLLAIEKQVKCRLLLNDEENVLSLILPGNDSDAEDVQLVSDQYSKPIKFEDGVKFEKISIISMKEGSDDETIVTFRPNGTADTAIIEIGDGKNKYTVYIMASTGRAKVLFGPAEDLPMDIIDLDEIVE